MHRDHATSFEDIPLHRACRLELVESSGGSARVRAPHRRELEQGMGMLHGGVYAIALDAAGRSAVRSAIEREDARIHTEELKINLLAATRERDIIATATVLRAGRSLAVVDARVMDDTGVLVAAGSATYRVA